MFENIGESVQRKKMGASIIFRKYLRSPPIVICVSVIVIFFLFRGSPRPKHTDKIFTLPTCLIGLNLECGYYEECKQLEIDVKGVGHCVCQDGYIRSIYHQCVPVSIRAAERPVVYTFDNGWKINETVCSKIDLTAVERTPLERITKELGIYIFDAELDLISKHIKAKGMFDAQDFNVMYHFFGNDTDTHFIDIGANLGIHTLKMAEVGKRVFGVEISNECVQHLCASTHFNKLEKQIVLIHNAIGADHRDLKYIKTKANFGFNFVEGDHSRKVMEHDFGKALFDGNSTTVVKSIMLDDLLDNPTFKGINSVFIKLDVEGFEHNVIKGSDAFFKRINVKGLYMEWNKQGGYDTGEYIVQKMQSRGFEAFNCGEFKTKTCTLMNKQELNSTVYNILWLPKKYSKYGTNLN